MRPCIPTVDQVDPYLRGMDDRHMYSNFGPLVEDVERRYALRFGVPAESVVSCSSATLGLQGAIALSPARRFHCPAWTFPASPLAVVNAGKELSFCDVSASTWQIQAPPPAEPDGLLPVLPFGAEIDLATWKGWSEVVVDAAASGGALTRDLSGLPRGWCVVISLHATKVLGVGEGGLVVFGDPERAERFRAYCNLGFEDRRESDFLGTNAKMSEIVAAYALAALDQWDVEESEWRAARRLVREAEGALGLTSACSDYPGVNPYWILHLPNPTAAAEMESRLAADGIGSRRWWPNSCARMPAFAGTWGDVSTPVTDGLAATAIGMPFFRGLDERMVDRVVTSATPRNR